MRFIERLVLASFFCAALPTAAHASVALSMTGGTGGTPVPDSVHGWEFTLNNSIIVSDLGLWDSNGDGFAISHDIGIFRLSDSALLTSATLSAGSGDTLLAGFRYVDSPDVSLLPGVSYVISYYSATGFSDTVVTNATGLITDPVLNLTTARWQTSAGGLALPSNTTVADRVGPNFLFTSATVPEAGAWVVWCILGVVGFVTARRKKRRLG